MDDALDASEPRRSRLAAVLASLPAVLLRRLPPTRLPVARLPTRLPARLPTRLPAREPAREPASESGVFLPPSESGVARPDILSARGTAPSATTAADEEAPSPSSAVALPQGWARASLLRPLWRCLACYHRHRYHYHPTALLPVSLGPTIFFSFFSLPFSFFHFFARRRSVCSRAAAASQHRASAAAARRPPPAGTTAQQQPCSLECTAPHRTQPCRSHGALGPAAADA